jgi:hypothetical protein
MWKEKTFGDSRVTTCAFVFSNSTNNNRSIKSKTKSCRKIEKLRKERLKEKE